MKIDEFIEALQLPSPAVDHDDMKKTICKELGDNIWSQYCSHIGNGKDVQESYDFNNETLGRSLIINGLRFGNIYKEFGLWIETHQKLFSSPILDIGCGTGILTCFLAYIFPGYTIVGTDVCENAINVAGQIARKLNLKNITFQIAGNSDYFSLKKWGIVFSSRTMHENRNPQKMSIMQTLEERAEAGAKEYDEYAKTVISYMQGDTTFISIERIIHYLEAANDSHAGWMQALMNNGAAVNEKYLAEMVVLEEGEPEIFFVSVYNKGISMSTGAAVYRKFMKEFYKQYWASNHYFDDRNFPEVFYNFEGNSKEVWVYKVDFPEETYKNSRIERLPYAEVRLAINAGRIEVLIKRKSGAMTLQYIGIEHLDKTIDALREDRARLKAKNYIITDMIERRI